MSKGRIKPPTKSVWFQDYKRPTLANPFWTLPPIADVVNHLRIVAGNLPDLLNRISEDQVDQNQILFLIEEQLADNKPLADLWRRYQLSYYRSQISIGTATVLGNYAKGTVDKSQQFVKDVGKQLMPEVFAQGAGLSLKDQVAQQVDEATSKYGGQQEESADPV